MTVGKKNPFLKLALSVSTAFLLSMTACGSKSGETHRNGAESLPDTLRVATLYSPSSYFIYRDEPMGYDYNLISQFAKDKQIALKLEVAPSLHKAIEMLDSGIVDVIAYEIPKITEYRDNIIPCGPRSETYQVLVQPKLGGEARIADVTDLPGHEVYVEDNTKYLYRLQNLNEELGGGIDIHVIDNDTIMTDDLIEMVASREIPLTVADNDIAKINATYYPSLDVSVDISFHQTSAWGVAPHNKWLGDSIDAWLDTDLSRQTNLELYKRYFEQTKVESNSSGLNLSDGIISKYDNLFKKYAAQIGWDWRLLAAISYQESRFNPNAVSWAGARGLMQIMPKTGASYGVRPQQLSDPETAIRTSAKILDWLNDRFKNKIPDDNERIKFILAAYNGGIGHIYDSQALARKYGLDSMKWYDNVERGAMMKSDPKYYNDNVVKYGYLRGRETTGYVRKILAYYDEFKRKIPA